MKAICANYTNGMVRFEYALTTLIIGMMFAIVSSAHAAVPAIKAAELIHKGNAVELIHQVKASSVEPIPELIHQMKKGVGAVIPVAPQTSKNRVNNNLELNELLGSGLLGEPELNDALGL